MSDQCVIHSLVCLNSGIACSTQPSEELWLFCLLLQEGPSVCAHCSWGDVQRFQLRPAHGPAERPDIWWGCQAHWLQIHEGGEAVQWAAPGQEGGGVQLVPPSQHLLCPHEETPLLWPLQVIPELVGWEQDWRWVAVSCCSSFPQGKEEKCLVLNMVHVEIGTWLLHWEQGEPSDCYLTSTISGTFCEKYLSVVVGQKLP